MSLRKIAGVLAIAGLLVGLVGNGVAASFVDQVFGQENINVGSFSCIIVNPSQGTIAGNQKSVTYNAPPITSSAASNAPFQFTVKNNGSIDQVLSISVSDSGTLSGKFSDMPLSPASPVMLPAGSQQTFDTGIQWTTLDNSDLGSSGWFKWTVDCNEYDYVVVTPGNMANSPADVSADPTKWFFYNDENDTIDPSLGTMVAGPGTPPAGTGSAQISVSGTQRRNLATYQFSGTPLASLTVLKFSTYNPSAGNGGSANRSGYLQFNVDFDGSDTWQKRLVFVPSQNGAVTQNNWKEWDAINGGAAMWSYSGATWPGTATPGTTLRTWNDIVTSYPGIRIRVTDSWLVIRVGEPYANGYTENIDAFRFATGGAVKQFDFEP
jgi:hypothetical protein